MYNISLGGNWAFQNLTKPKPIDDSLTVTAFFSLSVGSFQSM